MEPSPWVHFCASVTVPIRDAVTSLLGGYGLSTVPMPAEPDGYGLVVVNGIDDGLRELVRRASRRAVVLVIAVATSRPPIADFWTLLRAGATDVLVWDNLPPTADQVVARLIRLRTVRELSRERVGPHCTCGLEPRVAGSAAPCC